MTAERHSLVRLATEVLREKVEGCELLLAMAEVEENELATDLRDLASTMRKRIAECMAVLQDATAFIEERITEDPRAEEFSRRFARAEAALGVAEHNIMVRAGLIKEKDNATKH